MKKIIRIILIFAVFGIVGMPVAYGDKGLTGATVLKRMLQAEGSVAFTARQITTIARGPALTSEQIIHRDGFKGMRTEYVEPPMLRGEIMVDDGRVLAHFIPREKVMRTAPSRLAALRKRTREAAAAFRRGNLAVTLVGTDKIAGRTARVIEVRPKLRGGGPTRKFWVDAEKWIKLKTEDIAPDGTVASMSYYTKIDFVTGIPAEKFRFEPPPGVRTEREQPSPPLMPLDEVRRKVPFRILTPSYLPPGFKSAGAKVVPFRAGHLVVLRYTDNINSFSLFQSPGKMIERRFLKRLHQDPVSPKAGVYAWRHGDMSFTIVGNLASDQVHRVADSVK